MLPWKRAHRSSGRTGGPPVSRGLRTALSALVLALSAMVLPAAAGTTAHAESPAGARSATSGWNDYSCTPSAAHPRPVVLVHGTFGNAIDNWLGLAPYLVDRGYCVFSLDYGQLPGVPVFYGLGPIDESAQQLSDYVDRVLTATGAARVDVVGHSQGGMMPRYYLKFLGGATKVNALVGIAPSSHGTTLSGLTELLDYFPGAADVIDAHTPGLTDQVVGSDFMTRLNEGGDTVPGVHYTTISTRYDEVVTPYRAQFLDGPDVKNVVVQDLCPFDLSEHVAIGTIDLVAFHETANALDPAHATRTTCF